MLPWPPAQARSTQVSRGTPQGPVRTYGLGGRGSRPAPPSWPVPTVSLAGALRQGPQCPSRNRLPRGKAVMPTFQMRERPGGRAAASSGLQSCRSHPPPPPAPGSQDLPHHLFGRGVCAEHRASCFCTSFAQRKPSLGKGLRPESGEKAEHTDPQGQPLLDMLTPPSPQVPQTARHPSEGHQERPQTESFLMREGRKTQAAVGSAGAEAPARAPFPCGPTQQQEGRVPPAGPQSPRPSPVHACPAPARPGHSPARSRMTWSSRGSSEKCGIRLAHSTRVKSCLSAAWQMLVTGSLGWGKGHRGEHRAENAAPDQAPPHALPGSGGSVTPPVTPTSYTPEPANAPPYPTKGTLQMRPS